MAWLVCAGAALALLAGCSRGGGRPVFPPEVTGTVSFAEVVTVPAGADLRVTLSETARPGAEPTFIAEQTVPNPGRPPLRFRVAFPPSVIEPRAGYTLVARIELRGKTLFANERPVPVLTLGNPARADIVVTRTAEARPGR